MKKSNFEYDYKFDWIVRKAKNKEIAADKEDYKKKLMEKIEGKDKNKEQRDEEEDDNMA